MSRKARETNLQPATLHQVAELCATASQAVGKVCGRLSFDRAERLIGRKTPFQRGVGALVLNEGSGAKSRDNELLAEWQDFYHEVLGVDLDTSKLVFPFQIE